MGVAFLGFALGLVRLGRLAVFFAFNGAWGFGFVFSIRSVTSSSRERDLDMPQPLVNILRGARDVDFAFQLPLHNPKICALAMNIIAIWAQIEQDVAHAVIALMPGKSEPISNLLTNTHADSPKAAIRNVLAETLLLP